MICYQLLEVINIFHINEKENLTETDVFALKNLESLIKKGVIESTERAGSGHPTSALSSAPIIATLYATGNFNANTTDYTNEDVLILSKGHGAPALYSAWCAMGYFSYNDFLKNFRKPFTFFQGHPASLEKLKGIVPASTGSLGQGPGLAEGIAYGKHLNSDPGHVYAILGDAECREGSVFEAIMTGNKFRDKLENLIFFVDLNHLGIGGRPEDMMPMDIKGTFSHNNWLVYNCDLTGENRFQQLHQNLKEAKKDKGAPKVIICETIKGQGVCFMEGEQFAHGVAPNYEQCKDALGEIGKIDWALLKTYGYDENEYTKYSWRKNYSGEKETKQLDPGERKVYPVGDAVSPRKTVGKTLHDIMMLNDETTVSINDLAGSGGLKPICKDMRLEHRVFDLSLTEQNTMSFTGGLAIAGMRPYYYTFGKFYERSKDQHDMNIKSGLNIKYLVSHAFGLDLGEDGESHQIYSYLNLFTKSRCPVIMLADANQADAVMRWSVNYPGPAAIMSGRDPIPIISKENGEPFFDLDYNFNLSKADIIRDGSDATIITYGPMLAKALQARDNLKRKHGHEVRLINFSTPSLGIHDKFIDWSAIFKASKETGAILTVEEHIKDGSLGQKIGAKLLEKRIFPQFNQLAVPNYFKGTSGKPDELRGLNDIGLTEGNIRKQIEILIDKKSDLNSNE